MLKLPLTAKPLTLVTVLKINGNEMTFLNHVFLMPARHYFPGILFGQVIERILKMSMCYNSVLGNASIDGN